MMTVSPWTLLVGVLALHVTASAVCLVAYAVDKSAARRGRRRISERTLLALGLVGGWPGALLAQRWLRHKTAKVSFQWKFRASVVASVGSLGLAAWLLVGRP